MKRGMKFSLVLALFVFLINVSFVSAGTKTCGTHDWSYSVVPIRGGAQLYITCSRGCSSSSVSGSIGDISTVTDFRCSELGGFGVHTIHDKISGSSTEGYRIGYACANQNKFVEIEWSGKFNPLSILSISGTTVTYSPGPGYSPETFNVDCCAVTNPCVSKKCKGNEVYCIDNCGGEKKFKDCGSEENCVLGSCISCDPLNCEELGVVAGGKVCGAQDDGCGGKLDCGSCSGETCPAGLISLWKFDETSGTTAKDSADGNDGTLKEGVIINQPGKINTAFNFDGVNDYVNVGRVSDFSGLTAFTLEAWVKFDTDTEKSPDGSMIVQLNSGLTTGTRDTGGDGRSYYNYNVFHLARYENNKIVFGLTEGSGNINILTSNSAVNNGVWHHIVATWDKSAGSNNRKIYIDGAFDKSDTWNNNLANVLGPLHIGVDEDYFASVEKNDYMDGMLDEVAIYNRALTPTEVSEHYNARVGRDFRCEATCSDGVKDGDETGIDCGGSCPPCFVEPTYCADDNQIIMKLFSPSNSHGALWTEDYSYKICCDKIFGDGDECKKTDPHNGNPILWLFAEKNSHASKEPIAGSYETPVKYGDLVCVLEEKRCTENRKMVVSLYENSNSHITDPHYMPDGMVSWWRFDEAYGMDVSDSKKDNHGKDNGATWQTGIAGTGLNFDGVNNYVEIPDNPSLDLTTFTTEAWFNANSIIPSAPHDYIGGPYGSAIVGKWGDLGKQASYYIGLWPDGFLYTSVHNGAISKHVEASRKVNSGVWHHVVSTFDGTTLNLYVDGVLSGSTTDVVTPMDSNRPLQIGGLQGSDVTFPNFFPGIIDEVAIYNKALSAEEIQHRYNMGAYELKLCCKSGTYVPEEQRYWANMKGEKIGNDVVPIIKSQKGDTVKMFLKNTGLAEGTLVQFEIYENDRGIIPFIGSDDSIRTGSEVIIGIIDSEGNAVATWTITPEDLAKTFDLGEFYFLVKGGKSNELAIENKIENAKPYAEIIYPKKLEDVTDISNRRFKIGQNITFQARVYDEDDDLNIIWNFDDDNITTILGVLSTICKSESRCDLLINHSYENWGTKEIILTAKEKTREQEAQDDTDVFIYDLGINVFARITSPTRNQVFSPEAMGKVNFDGSESYAANCTYGSCTPGATCYIKTVGDSDSLYCYDFTKSSPLPGYDLWFNWIFSSGSETLGSWNSDYENVVEFTRPFYHPDKHWAKLKVGYEEI